MKHLKLFNLFESNEFPDDFEVIRSYMNEICEELGLEFIGLKDDSEMYITISDDSYNGSVIYSFFNKNQNITDIDKADKLTIKIRLRDSYLSINKEKVQKVINWLIDRIKDSFVKTNSIGLVFANPKTSHMSAKGINKTRHTKTLLVYNFDIIKKIL